MFDMYPWRAYVLAFAACVFQVHIAYCSIIENGDTVLPDPLVVKNGDAFGVIVAGESSVVSVEGGTLEALTLRDQAELMMSAGSISFGVFAEDDASLAATGGQPGSMWGVRGRSQASIDLTGATLDEIAIIDDAHANISGGTYPRLQTRGNGTLDLHQGDFGGEVFQIEQNSRVAPFGGQYRSHLNDPVVMNGGRLAIFGGAFAEDAAVEITVAQAIMDLHGIEFDRPFGHYDLNNESIDSFDNLFEGTLADGSRIQIMALPPAGGAILKGIVNLIEVPEPSAIFLVIVGMVGMLSVVRRRA